MPSLYRTALLALLTPAAAAGQDNPFALTGGSVKSAYIVYEVTGKPQPDNPMAAAPTVAELGVAPDRWMLRMVAPFELAGKKDTMKTVVVASGDSQYTYLQMGPGRGDGEVSVILRRHLAREYATLDAAGKSRFRENLKLVGQSSMSDVSDEYITLTGEKKGSETIAGHKCDVYQREETTLCVMPQAPGVVLRSTDASTGLTLVAKKVTLNGPVPMAATLLPKGVRWKRQGYDDEEFAPAIWEFKKQSDSRKVAPATLAKFAVGYLASPGAAAELKEMDGGIGEADEPGAADDAAEDESAD
ncbi:MAG: hypothetical protein ACREMZ_13550 [Gemmatimonadales bacterium]